MAFEEKSRPVPAGEQAPPEGIQAVLEPVVELVVQLHELLPEFPLVGEASEPPQGLPLASSLSVH